VHGNQKICKNSPKNPYFRGSWSFKVIHVDKSKKPFISSCYDEQQVCNYLQFFHTMSQYWQNNIFLGETHLWRPRSRGCLHQKANQAVPHQEHRRRAHLQYVGRWASRWIDHLSPWRMDSYLPRLGASPPFDWYQIIGLLLGEQRNVCANNLPKIVTWQCLDSESILGPFSHQSCSLSLHHQASTQGHEISSR